VEKIDGPVIVRFGDPANDAFVPLGEPEESEQVNASEVIYAAGTDVLTRHWNFRDSERTKVDEETTSAVFIVERVSAEPSIHAAIEKAVSELVYELSARADSVFTDHLDKTNRSLEL
jgi:DNA/RNA-binding domain of Phe-tRNA-synthetase-like protein